MTTQSHDPFDARLEAMFDEAARPYRHVSEAERFTWEVTARLARPERFRLLALGAAGAAGALIAGSQLVRLTRLETDLFAGALSGLHNAAFVGPELVVSLAMAGLALGFAAVLPRRPVF